MNRGARQDRATGSGLFECRHAKFAQTSSRTRAARRSPPENAQRRRSDAHDRIESLSRTPRGQQWLSVSSHPARGQAEPSEVGGQRASGPRQENAASPTTRCQPIRGSSPAAVQNTRCYICRQGAGPRHAERTSCPRQSNGSRQTAVIVSPPHNANNRADVAMCDGLLGASNASAAT